MKILVFAHRLELGGTQVNAVELAAALRDVHGHDVTLFATPGPMAGLAAAKGLRMIAAPDARFHPSPARMSALRAVVSSDRPDVLHAWDWWQCLEAYFAAHLPLGVPMVVTDMMMELTRVLPRGLATTFGTPELVDAAHADGRHRAQLILPPVDTRSNATGAVDGQVLRDVYGIGRNEVLLVTVSRLANFMKADSLVRTISAVRSLGKTLPLRLLIVGDGAARERLNALASAANTELGRDAVHLVGPLIDPRAAYAAADIVVGMGGSALRGMAFSKPVIVVGEQGFADVFSPETRDDFYYRGMYGVGDGNPGNSRLSEGIRRLAASSAERQALGEYAREFVVKNYSLEVVSKALSRILGDAVHDRTTSTSLAVDACRTLFTYVRERRFLTPSRDAHAADLKSELPR